MGTLLFSFYFHKFFSVLLFLAPIASATHKIKSTKLEINCLMISKWFTVLTGMNQIQISVDIGRFSISWNHRRLLTSIRWQGAEDEAVPTGIDSIPHPTPDWLPKFLDDFRAYCVTGSPFERIPWEIIDQDDWSEFQRKVYRCATLVPHSETRSYGWVAKKMDSVMAARAVGQALRKNPVLILIPCHRIVSHEGSLGGFMGKQDSVSPEVQLKGKLLEMERLFANPLFSFLTEPISAYE
jgi:O-6-methylguanine DNA methyltransferase